QRTSVGVISAETVRQFSHWGRQTPLPERIIMQRNPAGNQNPALAKILNQGVCTALTGIRIVLSKPGPDQATCRLGSPVAWTYSILTSTGLPPANLMLLEISARSAVFLFTSCLELTNNFTRLSPSTWKA